MNNYNTNKNGRDIEVSVFYDTDLSQMYFDENIRRENDELIYTASDQLPKTWGKEIYVNWRSISKKELYNAFKSYYSTFSKNTKQDLIDEILEDLTDIDDLIDFCRSNNIDYDLNYFTIETCGYSQGDYAEVIIPYALADIFGITKEELEAEDTGYIDNLFWDAPIYARAQIDGKGIYLEEALASSYEWDREAVIDYIVSLYDETIRSEISKLIPENPDYE